MIYVSVRPLQAPTLRIRVEVSLHVLVNLFLQVYVGLAKSSHDHIRAAAALQWNVAARIVNAGVGRIISERILCLLDGRFDDTLQDGRLDGRGGPRLRGRRWEVRARVCGCG